MTEHIVAVFRDATSADAAERDLKTAGITGAAIRRYRSSWDGAAGGTSADRPARSDVEPPQSGGFWGWLLGEEGPGTVAAPEYRTDSSLFERRAGAGDVVLSVTVTDDSQIHRAVEIL